MGRLRLTRSEILAFRHAASGLGRRVAIGPRALADAARAGLTDSMPRAAVLSLRARLDDTPAAVLDDPALVQIWGPRFSAYVVTESDAPIFTVGRHPESSAGRRRAEEMAAALISLGEDVVDSEEASRAVGIHPNAFRHATTTGMLRIHWDGARRPTIRLVPRPDIDPVDARRELVRRYLGVFGPGTPEGFSAWAGLRPASAQRAFDDMASEILAVDTPIGGGWVLWSDEERARSTPEPTDTVRLLPSGDVWYLLWGRDRELVVPDPDRRPRLWTSRVWPGAVVVGTEVVGTWRRSGRRVEVESWEPLDDAVRDAVMTEAGGFPLPDPGETTVRWV